MEHLEMLAGPRGRALQAGLVDLPDELLLPILRRVEDEYVASGQMSAEFLQLRAVCKRLKQGVDSAVTNLSRGVARRFCGPDAVLEVRDGLQRQLACWGGSLRRVELHICGDDALSQLLSVLGQSCPGLTALRVVKTGEDSYRRGDCGALAHLSSLASLESLSLTGFQTLTGTLPSLPSLRVLDTDFSHLTCESRLPVLEELAYGDSRDIIHSGCVRKDYTLGGLLRTHMQPPLRRLSLSRVRAWQLRLPKSLQVLELYDVHLGDRGNLGKDLPELVMLLVVHESGDPFPVEPQGLSELLSQDRLLRLKLQGNKRLRVPNALVPASLRLQTHLTALSLRAVQVPHLEEALPALTALTDLELGDLGGVEAVHFSQASLQHLRLEELPKLRLVEGLELQTGLRSLALVGLSLITHLPDFHLFPRLTTLELTSLRLHNWNLDSCSDLPSLELLHVSEVGQLAPQAASVAPGEAHAQPPPAVPISLDLGTSIRVTELDLRGVAGSTLELGLLPLIKKLRLQDCLELSQLLGFHLLPHLRSLELLPGMPKLLTLNIASCPSLTSFSCRPSHLQHLTMEDLPRLGSLGYLPDSLHTLHVAACHSLEKLDIGVPQILKDLYLHLQRYQPSLERQLRSVKLAGLAKLSGLVIEYAAFLESVQVSDCPLIEVSLAALPKLTAPNIHINDFYLRAANNPSLSSAASLPSPIRNLELQPVYPPPRDLPQSRQVLRKLALIGLPGLLTLDQVALQTGLTHLTLDGLRLSRLQKELASLTGLSELVLKNLEVESSEPLLPGNTSSWLKNLTVEGGTNVVTWAGLGTGVGRSATPPQVDPGPVGPEIRAFWSVTKLDLSELKVTSLDVSGLASIQELSVHNCQSLTHLAGITNLLHLTCVKLAQIPKLQELAIVSCPSLKSLQNVSVSPVHLRLEDLPSLELSGGCFHNHMSMLSRCPQGLNHCFPEARMPSLISLKLRGLPCLSIVLKDLEALEAVEVTECSSLNEVHFEQLKSLTSVRLNEPLEGASGEGSLSAPSLPRLSKRIGHLHLVGMPKLESVSCPPTLQNMVVRSCPALTSFPLIDFETLESLELEDVSEAILPIWLKQARHLQKLEFRRPLPKAL